MITDLYIYVPHEIGQAAPTAADLGLTGDGPHRLVFGCGEPYGPYPVQLPDGRWTEIRERPRWAHRIHGTEKNLSRGEAAGMDMAIRTLSGTWVITASTAQIVEMFGSGNWEPYYRDPDECAEHSDETTVRVRVAERAFLDRQAARAARAGL